MPVGDDKPKQRALTQPGGPRRHQSQTERDEQGFAALQRRNNAVPPIVHEDITGQYEAGKIDADELERRRHARDASVRERLAVVEVQAAGIIEVRKDLRTTDKLVDQHNHVIEFGVKPLLEKLPDQLGGIRIAQAALNSAIDTAEQSTRDALSTVALQIQQQSERIGAVEAEQAADRSRLTTVEKTATDALALATRNAAKLSRRNTPPSVDAKIGGFVRRNATKIALAIAVALGSAITGAISGYLSRNFDPAALPVKGTP